MLEMLKTRTGELVGGGVAVVLIAGGGAAIAATQFDSPSAQNSAIISDAASQSVSSRARSRAR